MNILESARIAVRGLRVNRLRSALTTLGIIIGVAAVIVLTALGNGIQSGVTSSFGPLTTQITVSPNPGAATGGRPAKELTDTDVTALRNPAKAPAIASVSPVVGGSALLQAAGGGQHRSSISGVEADYLTTADRHLLVGSMFDDAQVRSKAKVVVLGPNPVADLFAGDAGAALGRQVRIGRTSFRVIGVIAGNGQQDDVAIMPLGAARSYLLGGGDTVSTIIVRASSAATVPAALAEVNAVMDVRHGIRNPGERDYTAQALQSLLDRFTQILGFLTLFTTAVAGISLVVGGVGVANIMLVTVTERTREIGIRKAIGARRRAILQQFLLESTLLAGLGGIVGILIGIGISAAAGVVLPNVVPMFPAPIVSVGSVLLSFSISLLIGLVAGGYPADRAARLHPIDALRHQ